MGKRRAAALGALLAAAVGCGAPSGPDVRLTIRKGSPFREAAETLAVHGVVGSSRLFAMYAKLRGLDRSLRYGTYVIRQKMTWEQTLDALRTGRGIVHAVTIPEGFTIADIAPMLVDALGVPPDSIDAAVRDTSILHQLDVPAKTLEGYLFPDTYVFADGTTARDAVRMMTEQFEKAWKPQWTARLSRKLR